MSEEEEIEDDIENISESKKSSEKKESYRELKFRDYFIWVAVFIYLALYYNISTFRSFIETNLKFIESHYDVLIFFFIVLVIPLVLYFVGLFFRILRKVWLAFSLLKVRIIFSIVRINICFFGYITMPFALVTHLSFSHWGVWIFGLLILFAFNSFEIWRINNERSCFYDSIAEDQDVNEKLRKEGKKEIILIHPLLLILYPVILVLFLIYKFGDPIITESVDTFWAINITNDIIFIVIFWITIIFSICWWLLSFLIVIVVGLYEKYEDQISKFGKILYFCCVMYLIAKLIIFNLTAEMEEPGTSLTSLAISGGSGTILRFAKNKIYDIEKVKKGD